jgi:hypothetical protein
LIEEAIVSKTERGRTRRTLEAPGDVDKVVIAFKSLGNVIDRFQVCSASFLLASCPDWHRSSTWVSARNMV